MDKELFINNRKKLLELMENDSILVSFSRRKDTDDIFCQRYNLNRNYFYLCGVVEFENIVVLCKIDNKTSEMIFINPYDEYKAKWVGAPKSKEEVTNISGISNVRYLDTFDSFISGVINNVNNIYLDICDNELDANQLTSDQIYAKKLLTKYPFIKILNSRKLFTIARTVKSDIEIAEMKKAIEITNQGLINVLKHIKPAMEYELESYFDQKVKALGATGYSFPTIAASGANGCCLHYSENNSFAKDGDLILFDLGASLNMYCADISRTYPINGKFTPRQKQIYNIVLEGQKLVFNNAKPGVTTRELNSILRKYFAVELKKIGLINEGTDAEVSKYYFHGVSHHIGLDCHDLCDYGPLKAGCVISNEPGLYIPEYNIGIRIEDDVLITENGAEWLSPQIIKEVDEIENFIANNKAIEE